MLAAELYVYLSGRSQIFSEDNPPMKIPCIYGESIIMIALILMLCSTLAAQGSISFAIKDAGNNKILDPQSDTLLIDKSKPHEYIIQINIANDTSLGAFTVGLEISSDNSDNLIVNWLTQPNGWGPKGPGEGMSITTIPQDCRMQPLKKVWDFGSGAILIREDDVNGSLPDSLLYGGFAVMGTGLPPGPAAPMIEIHFSLDGLESYEIGYLCLDTAFIPPGGTLIFASQPPGLSWVPDFLGKVIFPVKVATLADNKRK